MDDKGLQVVLGEGPYRRQREALYKVLRAKYENEDTHSITAMWSKEFRLSVMDWLYRNAPWNELPLPQLSNIYYVLSEQQSEIANEQESRTERADEGYHPKTQKKRSNKKMGG